jgi:hypothetical protein
MADHAVGRNCPRDGTFTACAGAYGDENLVGTCAVCNQAVVAPNPYFADAQRIVAASVHDVDSVVPDPEPTPVEVEPEEGSISAFSPTFSSQPVEMENDV